MFYSRIAPVIAAGGLASSLAFCMSDCPYNEKIRGTYENKIRQHAPPEKIFETFASIKKGKEFFMTEKDFFHSLTPYNYATNIDQDEFFEQYGSRVFKIIDVNGDGVLDFSEYFFFVVVLSLSNNLGKTLFNKVAVDGHCTKKQFTAMMNEAREFSAQGRKVVESGKMPDPRSTKSAEEDFQKATKSMVKTLFKEQDLITWQEYLDLRNLFTEELLFFEFHSFEIDENNTMDIKDFAKSLISYFPTSKIDKYLNRLAHLPIQGRITFGEFVAFQKILHNVSLLQKYLLEVSSAKQRPPAVHDLQKIIAVMCYELPFTKTHALSVNDLQTQMFFQLLDLDDSGFLEPEEFVDLIATRQSFGTSQPKGPEINLLTEGMKMIANAMLEKIGMDPYFTAREDPKPAVYTTEEAN